MSFAFYLVFHTSELPLTHNIHENGGKNSSLCFFFIIFFYILANVEWRTISCHFVTICVYMSVCITNHAKEKRDKRNHNFHRFGVHALVNSLDA